MFRFFLIALLLVKGAVSTSCVAEPVAQDSFFEPVVSAEHELDPDQLYPKGRLFPVSLYSVIKDDLPMLKEDGFTAVGPCYDKDQEKIIAYAQIAHLPTFYAVGIKMNFLSKEPLDLTDEQIREKITQQVSFAAGHPEIAWWYIHPEELRWWVKREMNYMKVVYQAIKAADPLNRPVWMYEANNRACTEKGGMQITLQNQDICGKGIYVNR
ncbi:MAG: hypothetical protein KAH24_01290, partial [Holophagae bacterium]|nr:hypothetical protein [Holophagae bacterium]